MVLHQQLNSKTANAEEQVESLALLPCPTVPALESRRMLCWTVQGEVAWLIADDAEGAMAGGRLGLPKLRRRFSIGAYPAVSPRMKLIATNKNPKMAN